MRSPVKRKLYRALRGSSVRDVLHVPNCMFCSGIGDYHSGACEPNKAKMLSFLARKKKLAAAKGATPAQPHKSTRRGTRAGLCKVERKILQENGQLVAQPAPAQP